MGNVGRIRRQKLIRSGVALAPGEDILVGVLSWPGVKPAPDVEQCWHTMRRPAWGRGGAPVAAARLRSVDWWATSVDRVVCKRR